VDSSVRLARSGWKFCILAINVEGLPGRLGIESFSWCVKVSELHIELKPVNYRLRVILFAMLKKIFQQPQLKI